MSYAITIKGVPMPLLNDIPPAWACDEHGFCWWGEWSSDLERWDWRFDNLQPENGFTHYLPYDVPILPARCAHSPCSHVTDGGATMSWDPASVRQEWIETACENAIAAMYNELVAASKQHRPVSAREQLTVALKVIEDFRTLQLPPGIEPFSIADCIGFLEAWKTPQVKQP